MDWLTPAWVQGGALGLAAVVVGLASRFVQSTQRESAKREQLFFTTMEQQRHDFASLMERQNEKFDDLSRAFDRVATGFTDVLDRLEAIEAKLGTRRRIS